MKQLFEIKIESAGDEQKVLSLRVGANHCCFAMANKTGNIIYQIVYIAIDDWNENEWTEIIETYQELSNNFYEVLIAYDFPESTLVPLIATQNDESVALLKALYGVNSLSSIISESVTGWQLKNMYAVPKELKNLLQNKFPSARFWHQYSLGIRNINSISENGLLIVDFRKEEFVVIATGRNNIFLTQTFEYNTPADVLYYLIKICNQFSFSEDEVQVQLSGLLDKESSLYKELYQYFINIDFRNSIWNAGDEYPSHFFTSLNDLAQCAS